jgi:hypothetical protein
MFNRFVIWLAGSPFHRSISNSVVVVKYKGRRSGKLRAVPVNYVIDNVSGSRRRLWITSTRERVWWRNFIEGHEATLILQGKAVTTELFALVEQEQVAAGLASYLGSNTRAARYFNVRLDDNGLPNEADLRREAGERVVIYADL